MYRILLSWRYLQTRWIAMASIISVMLGVATLIVVNSVMAGFSEEMYKRLHGILSDLVCESGSMDGTPDPQSQMMRIEKVIGDQVEGMTPIVHVPALLRMKVRGEYHTRQINLIGIDESTYGDVSDFSQYLLHPDNQRQLSFLLREDGYAPGRKQFPPSGWRHRRLWAEGERILAERIRELRSRSAPSVPTTETSNLPEDPYASQVSEAVFDPAREQHSGIVLGIAICSIRGRTEDGEVRDFYLAQPGDDVEVIFPNAGASPKPVNSYFTVVDLYESKMSEYDASFAFVPLRKLQEMRGMIDPLSGITSVTSIQIKLKPGADLAATRDKLRAAFPPDQYGYRIQSWRDMQGPLLSAVQMETTILNILLFMIIAVAGFGILATFYMIVVEKTRDIGILKALGAPSRGVMSIFLGYGLSLGAVGAGVGMVLGLLFVGNINAIAAGLEMITGQEVFDPTVYYFDRIPTNTNPWTVMWVVGGAMVIAVLASVLPSLRAARLHPVLALRHES
jgi:lipoprotein-releasing system permease protein